MIFLVGARPLSQLLKLSKGHIVFTRFPVPQSRSGLEIGLYIKTGKWQGKHGDLRNFAKIREFCKKTKTKEMPEIS